MKYFILFIVKLLFSVGVFSQNNTKSVKSISSGSIDNSADLRKYVWSHMNVYGKDNNKPPLDFDALDNWTSLNHYLSISNNGEYFSFGIKKGAKGWERLDSVVVQSTKNDWRKVFSIASPGFFSGDNKQYIFMNGTEL